MDVVDRKVYIFEEHFERGTNHGQKEHVYAFCDSARDAMSFDDQYIAELGCSMFNYNAVIIDSVRGGKHTIDNFEVEKFENRFVIFCIAPFIYTARGGTNQEQSYAH